LIFGEVCLGKIAAMMTVVTTNMIKQYFWNILISIDQFFNAVLFGNPDETLSSRMGKNVREGKCKGCYFICRILHRLDPEHCKKSIEEDENSEIY
jgi:hypothetical protein